MRSGRFVRTNILPPDAAEALGVEDYSSWGEVEMVLEHERVPFPSYAWEWPPEMLHAAAALTLDIAEALAAECLGLKDATPHNVLFSGSQPVFIDALSVERRESGDCTWLPYAQFARTFLLPLLANQRFGLPFDQLFLTRRDGVEPVEICRMAGSFRKWLPPFLTLATIPERLGRRAERKSPTLYRKRPPLEHDTAAFVLKCLFRQLRCKLAAVEPKARRASVWSGYMTERPSYTEAEFEAKSVLVQQVLDEYRPDAVLDIGCNTGHFAILAARSGASVVAIDYDPVVVGHLWRQAHGQKLDILPLVVNLARPTPDIGWRNGECVSFLGRAKGHFDAVFMLAVLHHLLISERIPLAAVLDLAAELTTNLLVIEFVEQQDPMFRRLQRGRDHLYENLTRERFEAATRSHFEIARSHRVGQHRVLYSLTKRDAIRRA
jgi:SAM-dependent methyltransferase